MDRLDATRGRSPVPAPPRGFAPIVHTPGGSPRSSTHQGVRHPGFRPGLWSTGPTARPGTGERPVGAPDHSQGRNPWAVKPQGETQGGETPRRLRKPRGKCRETCAACANAAANAVAFAPLAQTPRQTPRNLRGLRKPSENTEQPLTVKILAYGKRQNIDAYRRHHQRD